MFVLGIQGSPRKNGNSDYLLTSFLKECEAFGAKTQIIHPGKLDIKPCEELIVCEKKGFCPIKDEMEEKGYSLVKKADVVVLASPVFFYNVTAQAKIFIDRCQMFWGRKYKLKLVDPDSYSRQGFLLSVGASGGKRLFEGVELTAKYFFDAISADFSGALTYKNVEDSKDILPRAEVPKEIRDAVKHLLEPLLARKTLLFVSKEDSCRSHMAAAFVKEAVKGRARVLTAGYEPGAKIDPAMVKAMAEKGLDLKYQTPHSLDQVLADLGPGGKPDRIIFMGADENMPSLPGDSIESWDLLNQDKKSLADLGKLRDEIESRARGIASSLGV